MKTGITVTKTVRTDDDVYRLIKTTKSFNDDATIGEVKAWIKLKGEFNLLTTEVSLLFAEISDISE